MGNPVISHCTYTSTRVPAGQVGWPCYPHPAPPLSFLWHVSTRPVGGQVKTTVWIAAVDKANEHCRFDVAAGLGSGVARPCPRVTGHLVRFEAFQTKNAERYELSLQV